MAEEWIIWLNEQAGEILLGLAPAASTGKRRFAVVGTSKNETGFGIWVEVEQIQEIEIATHTKLRAWGVEPKSCLIPWHLISYVQSGPIPSSGKIGFIQKDSK